MIRVRKVYKVFKLIINIPNRGRKMLKIKLIKRWYTNIFLLLIVLIIGLFLIELGLNLFFPQGNPLWGYDSSIGVKLEPNKCSRYISEEYNVELCSNNEGFKDIDHNIEKESSKTRIAVLGDSMVIAREVEMGQRFTELLEPLLEKECGKEFEVMNFGVGGQGTAGQLLTFKHFVKKYNPDYTILVIFSENDISNNYLPLEDRDYIPTYKLDHSGELEYVPFKKAPLISNPILSVISREIFPNLLSLSGKSFRRLSKLIRGQKNKIPHYLYVYSSDDSEDYQIAWDIEQKLLANFKEEVNAIGQEFIVSLLFSKNQVTDFNEFSENPIVKTFNRSKPNRRLSKILEDLDIIHIDLLNNINLDAKDRGYENLFFEINAHLTEKGHQFMANLIASNLLNKTEICKNK